MNKHYIILALTRSGSSLVRSFCHEPFNQCLFEPLRSVQLRKLSVNINCPEISQRMENPVRFFNYIFNLKNKKYNGAKILISSLSDDVLYKIVNSNKFKIILLYRKNLLETFVSRRIAGITRQWSLKRNNINKIVKLKKSFILDKEDAEEYMNRIYKKTQACKAILDDYDEEDFLETTYETINLPGNKLNIHEINRIRKFIGLLPVNEFIPKMTKQNNEDTYRFIQNRGELESSFGEKFGYLGKRSEPSIWD